MAHFLDSVRVVQSDGEWNHGTRYPVAYFDRAYEQTIVDICDPQYPLPEKPDVEFGEYAYPVAVLGYMKCPTRCTPEAFDTYAQTAMLAATEYETSRLLWHGTDLIDDYDGYLTHADIDTVDREATHAATVAAVLAKAYANTEPIDPLLHLGFEIAIALGVSLKNLDVPYVVAPGYPTDAIAVTDNNVTVNLSPITATSSVQTDINRRQVELIRFASVEFDRYRVVRAA